MDVVVDHLMIQETEDFFVHAEIEYRITCQILPGISSPLLFWDLKTVSKSGRFAFPERAEFSTSEMAEIMRVSLGFMSCFP